MTGEWRIVNMLRGAGPGRTSQDGTMSWEEPPADPMFALVADRITQQGWTTVAAIPGYCEECEANGEAGETLVDWHSISDPIDRSNKATCLRCGYDDATPNYDQAFGRSSVATGVALALFPESFAPDYCRWCSNGESCPRKVSECPAMRASALDAGIPLDVVMGRAKLGDHFSRDQIDRATGRIVTCETCGGRGFGNGPASDMQCPTCEGAGEVRR